MELNRAIEAAAEAMAPAFADPRMAKRYARIAVEAAAPILTSNQYADTKLMRALQRAERAEALADELAEAVREALDGRHGVLMGRAALAHYEEARRG